MKYSRPWKFAVAASAGALILLLLSLPVQLWWLVEYDVAPVQPGGGIVSSEVSGSITFGYFKVCHKVKNTQGRSVEQCNDLIDAEPHPNDRFCGSLSTTGPSTAEANSQFKGAQALLVLSFLMMCAHFGFTVVLHWRRPTAFRLAPGIFSAMSAFFFFISIGMYYHTWNSCGSDFCAHLRTFLTTSISFTDYKCSPSGSLGMGLCGVSFAVASSVFAWFKIPKENRYAEGEYREVDERTF